MKPSKLSSAGHTQADAKAIAGVGICGAVQSYADGTAGVARNVEIVTAATN